VEISPTAEPPVCRIMDFGKFLYTESKKQQAARRNQKQTQVTLRFRGREMAHQELGRDLLKRLEEDLKGVAVVEQYPRMEGRQMVMVMSPRKR
jgi:translation initiation factor IF-3